LVWRRKKGFGGPRCWLSTSTTDWPGDLLPVTDTPPTSISLSENAGTRAALG
jgi:hypothetical protein